MNSNSDAVQSNQKEEIVPQSPKSITQQTTVASEDNPAKENPANSTANSKAWAKNKINKNNHFNPDNSNKKTFHMKSLTVELNESREVQNQESQKTKVLSANHLL